MKTVCVYHSIDLDGWMSAAIVKHWFLQQPTERQNVVIDLDYKGENTQGSHWQDNSLYMKGYNYGQPIPDLSEFDKVIMCDISFPYKETCDLVEKLGLNYIWIDHHISAIKENEYIMMSNRVMPVPIKMNGIRDTKFAACELTWKYFFPNEPMPEIVRLLGRYDCFGHKGTDEEQKVLEFQYGARQCITNYEEAYEYLQRELYYISHVPTEYDVDPILEILIKGKAIYQYLCTEAKQVYKNGFEIYFPMQHTEVISKKFICINKERFNPINFGINYHADGYDGCACFYYDGVAKLWRFSLYNDNGLVDCSAITKQFGGGGHKGAAGMVLNTKTFLNLIGT